MPPLSIRELLDLRERLLSQVVSEARLAEGMFAVAFDVVATEQNLTVIKTAAQATEFVKAVIICPLHVVPRVAIVTLSAQGVIWQSQTWGYDAQGMCEGPLVLVARDADHALQLSPDR
jgi:hypothetical protein